MAALMRLAGATRHAEAIDRWLDARPGELGAMARHWFGWMRGCGDDVLELLHDNYPTVCVRDAPFAYVGVFTAHVNVGFFHGVALPDPARLLQGTGKSMRHVKLRPGAPSDRAALEALIVAAHRDIRARWRPEK